MGQKMHYFKVSDSVYYKLKGPTCYYEEYSSFDQTFLKPYFIK